MQIYFTVFQDFVTKKEVSSGASFFLYRNIGERIATIVLTLHTEGSASMHKLYICTIIRNNGNRIQALRLHPVVLFVGTSELRGVVFLFLCQIVLGLVSLDKFQQVQQVLL